MPLNRIAILTGIFAFACAGAAQAQDAARFWSSVFAGRSSLAGDTALGTQDVKASTIINLFGADRQVNAYNLVGASLGIGHQTFSASSGHGHSNDITLSVYGRHFLTDHIYVAESLGFGRHDVSTSRAVLIGGGDVLKAAYRATDLGGRLEAGYSLAILDGIQLAPFAAFVGDSYSQPGFGESSASGQSFFGVTYQPVTIGVTHLELGARAERNFSLGSDVIALDVLAAFEKELDDSPLIQASFQTFPGSSLALRGTSPAENTALLGLGLRYRLQNDLTFGGRTDARLGAGTTIVTGTLDIAWHW
ncbi:MAG: autotransporter outer membrane beta-barrel domain-containing protein [Alphaproteobacteria bacterium]|nr:autotransporter outer membrane beta-barrel domain-containing protein [Alphaproteobacteria bacterium]